MQRVVIELKILHKGLESTLVKRLDQTADYADRCNADEAHPLISIDGMRSVGTRRSGGGKRGIISEKLGFGDVDLGERAPSF